MIIIARGTKNKLALMKLSHLRQPTGIDMVLAQEMKWNCNFIFFLYSGGKQNNRKNEKLRTCKHHVSECKTLHEAIHGWGGGVDNWRYFSFCCFLMMCFFMNKIKTSLFRRMMGSRAAERGDLPSSILSPFRSSFHSGFFCGTTISFIEGKFTK